MFGILFSDVIIPIGPLSFPFLFSILCISAMYDRIVAEATPRGRGGISIIRFSGGGVLEAVRQFVRFRTSDGGLNPIPRRAYIVDVVAGGEVIDEGLLLWFQGPRSFSGEDVVELQLHGNPLIVRLVLEEARTVGFRFAEAGEFTQRAFSNGRLDLTQVDALAGLLEAEQAELLGTASRQLGGALRRRLLQLRERVLSAIASLELGLDFSEEGYEFVGHAELVGLLQDIVGLVSEMRRAYRSQASARSIPMVALLGEPNAGKSTLFNAILGYERSITHHEPGTTRDYVSEVVEFNNCRFRLVDTAGLRDTSDSVESRGVARVREVVDDADLVIAVVDGSRPDAVEVAYRHGLFVGDGDRVIILATHADSPTFAILDVEVLSEEVLAYSSRSTADVARVCGRISEWLLDRSNSFASAYIVSRRQDEILAEAERRLSAPAIDFLLASHGPSVDPLLLSSDLRYLLPLFSELVGEATNEDVLDRVFSQFCIGK